MVQYRRKRRNPWQWLSVSDVAKKTGFHRNTVLYWIRQGQLGASRNKSGYYLVKLEDLERFLVEYYY
ncbi:helix-turn-helix domain-containing protein [Chloroflexota bacterium]